MNIGKNIAEFRKAKGMTQEALAEIIGVSAQAISKWENGANLPDIMLLPVIAATFGVTVDELFNGRMGGSRIGWRDIPAETYRLVSETMRSSFEYDPETLERVVNDMREDSKCLSMVYSDKGGCSYFNRDIAVSIGAMNAKKLLDDPAILKNFTELFDEKVRRVLSFALQNPMDTMTLNFLAKNCDMTLDEVREVIGKLAALQIARVKDIEMDGEKIPVVEMNLKYKLSILLTIYYLADLIGKNIWYNGYVGAGYGWLKND